MFFLSAQECLTCEWNGNPVILTLQSSQLQIWVFAGSDVTVVSTAARNGREIRPKQHTHTLTHTRTQQPLLIREMRKSNLKLQGDQRCPPVQCVNVVHIVTHTTSQLLAKLVLGEKCFQGEKLWKGQTPLLIGWRRRSSRWLTIG